MLEARPGICIRCDARGAAGAACETRTCKKTKTHFLPEEYASQADQQRFLLEPMIGRVIDDWLVVDVLGRGGFGVVYLVLQLPIFLKAALKLLHRDPQPAEETPGQALARRSAQAKFAGEAQALASLTHPGIVRLLKFGSFDGAPYLVMEFAPGRALGDLMEANPRTADIYKLDNAQHVLRQLVNALEAAHLGGIVHRDVKPGNIVIQSLPGDPYFVRVLDFGIAKFLSEGSNTSLSAGTPIYMAPEQFDREKIGPWSDLYAVGVMTFELLFGQPPFGASTVERVLARKLAPDADPLAEIRGRVPAAVEAFFKRALARRPEDRFASATELRAGLDALFAVARTLPREGLLGLVHVREDDPAFASTDRQVGGPAFADTFASDAPSLFKRIWPWAFGVTGLAAAAVGVALLASPGATPAPPDPDALAATAPASDDDATTPPALTLAALPDAGQPAPAPEPDAAPDSEPAPEPDAAPEDDTTPELEDVVIAPRADALPDQDTRGTRRAKDVVASTVTDAPAPAPDTSPRASVDAAPSPADTSRPYTFVDF